MKIKSPTIRTRIKRLFSTLSVRYYLRLKHCSSTNPILIHLLLPTSPRLNSKHHPPWPSDLCLPESLNLAAAYRFCSGQAPVNKLVPATLLLWALSKSRVYDYDYDYRHTETIGNAFDKE